MDLIAYIFLVVMVDTDDTQRIIHDGRWTTPGVWHKLPTGELTRCMSDTSWHIKLDKLKTIY